MGKFALCALPCSLLNPENPEEGVGGLCGRRRRVPLRILDATFAVRARHGNICCILS